MEAENRRIMEFVNNQDTKKESRMNEMREREEAKENLRKQVETRPDDALTILHRVCLFKKKGIADVLFFLQLSERIQRENQQREEMEQVREEFYLEEQEQAHRQKEIVSVI